MRETELQEDLNLLLLVMALLVRILSGANCVLFRGRLEVLIILSSFFLFSGFIKFLGPYYMLLITKRRQIGAICGHNVYAISKSEIIPLPNSAVRAGMVNYKNENRLLTFCIWNVLVEA